MKKALIITGGYINFEKTNVDTSSFDLIIAADCGYVAANKLNIVPNIIMGDFDSANKPSTFADIITFPKEKDDSDTMLACNLAVDKGFSDILILGGTGGRADHFLANVFTLKVFKDKNISVSLADGDNTISVLKNETAFVKQNGGYFSLFAAEESVVSLSGCKYPLDNFVLTQSNPSFAISNEVVGNEAVISVKGTVILCECSK